MPAHKTRLCSAVIRQKYAYPENKNYTGTAPSLAFKMLIVITTSLPGSKLVYLDHLDVLSHPHKINRYQF